MTSHSTRVLAKWKNWRERGGIRPSLAFRHCHCGFAAFEHGDFSTAIETFAPLAAENERIGGSRAQHDLIEFTLLKAYLSADRLEEAQRLISARRPGASGIPVTRVAGVH
jgi:hypothetical protein